MNMESNVQLLAHVGAPCSRKDDDRQRSQLRAYMHLSPAQVTTVLRWQDTVPVLEIPDDDNATLALGQNSIESALYLQDTQLAYTALESQLFTSTPAVPRSGISIRKSSVHSPPGDKHFVGIHGRTVRSPSAAERASRESIRPSQSSYLVSPFKTHSSKRPRLDGKTTESSSSGQDAGENYSSQFQQSLLGVRELREVDVRNQTGASSGSKVPSNETTSEMPTSYSLSEVRSESVREHSTDEREHATSERHNASPGDERRRASDLIASKASGSIERYFAALPQKSPHDGLTDAPQLESDPEASTIATVQSISTEIDPPEPEVGYGPFTTHLTRPLQRLALNTDIHKAYKPISVAREIQLLERGYWFVDCSIWPMETQVEFWNYLELSISSGKLGWGVRCVRGPRCRVPSLSDASVAPSDPVTPNANIRGSLQAPSFGPVKVYCWGEMVKHIYLLLYIASGSKVRKLGLQWLDAGGTVIVQMPSP